MFRNHERKWKILFGFVDAFLTAAAFALAYELRQSLPLSLQFFLLPEMRTALLAFCVFTWVVSGYWLNVYARFDSVVVGRILRDSFRQAGCGALALIILVFIVKLDISRVFLGGFVVLSWALLVAFRLSARSFMPSISRHFGAERNVFIVGTGARALHLARNLEPYRRYGLEIRLALGDWGERRGSGLSRLPARRPALGALEEVHHRRSLLRRRQRRTGRPRRRLPLV